MPVTGVSIDESTLALEINATQQLVATITPANANQAVTWSSSNETIATVDNTGLVTAIAEGTATITAASVEDSTKFATCEVTVAEEV